jgi:hypothetical protein
MKIIKITKQFNDEKPTIKEISLEKWEQNKEVFLKLGWKVKE